MAAAKLVSHHAGLEEEGQMERREFLKVALGVAAGVAATVASAQAAPLMPQPLDAAAKLPSNPDAQPAVTSGDEVDRLKPEEVRWGRGRRWGFRRRRYWGYRRRRYWGYRRRRYWGWHRRRRRFRRWRRRAYW
jgi:hypothetical protein